MQNIKQLWAVLQTLAMNLFELDIITVPLGAQRTLHIKLTAEIETNGDYKQEF